MKTRFCMIVIACVMAGAGIRAFAETYSPPTVEDLKAKADAGDLFAQAMLGESYVHNK